MFTGLITYTARVKACQHQKLTLQTQMPLQDIVQGQSIAINGCCLTVVDIFQDQMMFDLNVETENKTYFTKMQEGQCVNIERALVAGQPLDGHFVSGHVDTIGTIVSIKHEKESHVLTIGFDTAFSKWVVEKGSIAIDGISLTVNEVWDDRCTVCIIPHTWQVTNLGEKKEHESVHIEFDMMAKFFEKQAKPYMEKVIKDQHR